MYGYGYRYNSGLVVGSGGGGGGFPNTYSLDYDGVDDYVETGGVYSELDGLSNTAFSFWMKTSNNAGVRIILAIGTPSGDYRAAQFQIWSQNGAIRIYYNGLGYTAGSNSVITNDVWTHVLITRDSSRAINDKVRIYINGVDETSSENTRYLGTASAADTGLFIGKHPNGYASPFLDNIDEVAIYNQDMAAYISEIYSVDGAVDLNNLDTAPQPIDWYRNGDNGSWKSPQWLIPNNENFAGNKVSNYSFEFDGVDDYVNIGNPSALQITGALTLSVWTKLSSSVGTQSCIMSKDSGAAVGQRAFSFWGKIVNKPVFYIWNGGSSYNVGGTTNIADDTWHHVAVVYLPSTSLRIYVDGVLEGTNTTSIPASINNANYDFKLGHFAGSLFEFKGLMDEVSVFDSDQSANISTLYNGGTPTTLPSGAVAHYRMGEEATFSTNWTVPDAVGSNDGTSVNMTIEDRVGDAPNSTNNAVSFNMDEVDRVEDVPS